MDFRKFVHNITLGIAFFCMLMLPLSALGFINYTESPSEADVLSATSRNITLPRYINVVETSSSNLIKDTVEVVQTSESTLTQTR